MVGICCAGPGPTAVSPSPFDHAPPYRTFLEYCVCASALLSYAERRPRSGTRYDRYRWNRTALGFTNQLTARCRIALEKSNT